MRNESSHAEEILREYDHLSEIYDRKWRHYLQGKLDKVLEFSPLNEDEEVLDVACGTGELEIRLILRYNKIRITACDISSAMLKVAREKLKNYCNISFLECPADEIPIANESKDIIICCNSFHFFKRSEKVLKEWQRILRQNGSLFVLDWCRDFWFCKVLEFLKARFDRAHHHIYTVEELSSLLVTSGFIRKSYWRFKVGWLWGMLALSGQKF